MLSVLELRLCVWGVRVVDCGINDLMVPQGQHNVGMFSSLFEFYLGTCMPSLRSVECRNVSTVLNHCYSFLVCF